MTIDYLLVFYSIWLVCVAVLFFYINPKFVPPQFRDDTIQLTVMAFMLINVIYNFIIKTINRTHSVISIIIYLLVVATFVISAVGVYYWVPTHVKNPEDQTVTKQIILSSYTLALMLLNLTQQYYRETIYSIADSMSIAATTIGGKRPKLK